MRINVYPESLYDLICLFCCRKIFTWMLMALHSVAFNGISRSNRYFFLMCFLIQLFPKGLNEERTVTSFIARHLCMYMHIGFLHSHGFHFTCRALNKSEQIDIGTGVCRLLKIMSELSTIDTCLIQVPSLSSASRFEETRVRDPRSFPYNVGGNPTRFLFLSTTFHDPVPLVL